MRDTIDMARETGACEVDEVNLQCFIGTMAFEVFELKAFEALVRADERENGQKWFDAVTAPHKQAILAEREACAYRAGIALLGADRCLANRVDQAIRARGEASIRSNT